jgi:carbamoyltransferase
MNRQPLKRTRQTPAGRDAGDRVYVGLAATLHDPAIALVAPDGRPVFAESTERALQSKRAFNCPPDDLVRAPRLLQKYFPNTTEIVVAVSWSSRFLSELDASLLAQRASAVGARSDWTGNVEWPLPHPLGLLTGLRNSVSLAGLNLWASSKVTGTVSVRRFDHHLTHAANAACTSPFDECAVAVVDGYGEDQSVAFFRYEGGRLAKLDSQPRRTGDGSIELESLGMFYARVCALCGFDPLAGEEWKVMGLAAYGHPDQHLCDLLRPMLRVNGLRLERGCDRHTLRLNLDRAHRFAREAGDDPFARADLAASGQLVFEEKLAELLANLYAHCPSENLAFAGGCALNSTFNGKLPQLTPFSRLHVPSAPADDGNALGAAFVACMEDGVAIAVDNKRADPYLGSTIEPGALERLVRFGGISRLTLAPPETIAHTASLLAAGKIVAWVQGRAEFGPRALGNRSILADPRSPDVKDRINQLVKFRERFRPFAPSILDGSGPEYFEDYRSTRYMERTLRFRPDVRDRVSGVVHVDGTGRLQSVRYEWNPRFHALLTEFHAMTGVPLLLNTSLNVMGKPIVHSLEDCLGVFLTTGIDALVVEDVLFEK